MSIHLASGQLLVSLMELKLEDGWLRFKTVKDGLFRIELLSLKDIYIVGASMNRVVDLYSKRGERLAWIEMYEATDGVPASVWLKRIALAAAAARSYPPHQAALGPGVSVEDGWLFKPEWALDLRCVTEVVRYRGLLIVRCPLSSNVVDLKVSGSDHVLHLEGTEEDLDECETALLAGMDVARSKQSTIQLLADELYRPGGVGFEACKQSFERGHSTSQ